MLKYSFIIRQTNGEVFITGCLALRQQTF